MYVVAFVFADLLATKLLPAEPHVRAGFNPWYLGAALDLALFAATSWRSWPLVGIALMLRGLLFGSSPQFGPLLLLVYGLASGLGYAGCYVLATRIFDLSLALTRIRDVLVFFIVLVFLGPLLTSAYVTPFIAWLGIIPWSAIPEQFFAHAAGDAVGIAAFLPAFLILSDSAWRRERVNPFSAQGGRAEFIAALAFLVLAIVFVFYIANMSHTNPHFAPAFLPLAWLAVRFGLRGAAWAMLVTDGLATALVIVFPSSFHGQILFQGLLVFIALNVFIIGALSDTRLQLIARLERLTLTDALTGLPNRAAIERHVSILRSGAITLALIDIDNTRLFNESLGRSSTDALLIAFGERLQEMFGIASFVGRFSADEFAIVLTERPDEAALRRKIEDLFTKPFATTEAPLFLSGSVGIVAVDSVTDTSDFVRLADAALERAKQHAPEPVAVRAGDANIDRQTVRELHRALDAHEFVVYYQPIFRIGTDGTQTLDGAEALLRWDHPQRGVLRPAAFFDVLERLAIAEHVGWWVLEQALRDISGLRARFGPLRSWVNLSARQVRDPDMFARICRALTSAGVESQGLVVEMNERILANDDHVVRSVTAELREIGVGVAIDDFGTGGSSYGRVRDVPANILKIDRSFVSRAQVDAKSYAVASGIARLGLDLGMELVAEGVENQAELATMLELGCTYIQGFELAHPMPILALTQLALLA